MLALSHGADDTPDKRLHDVRQADRYLLCSDGLSTVVPAEDIRRVLAGRTEPEQTVRELVAPAHGSGGPDNVSCVVADVLETAPRPPYACQASSRAHRAARTVPSWMARWGSSRPREVSSAWK